MRKAALLILLTLCMVYSCNNKDNTPDVDHIRIDLQTQRFEQDLFKTDSLGFSAKLLRLQQKYPLFGDIFFSSILNADPQWSADSVAAYLNGFMTAYQPVYDTAQLVFKDFGPYEAKIKKGLQLVQHYFPAYKAPRKIITYIGPLDGAGDGLSEDAIIVGLQFHLGKQYSLYRTEMVQQTYPEYVSRRFEPEYIDVNVMNRIVYDMFPENLEDKDLLMQMIEKGKRLYVLHRLLPGTPEHLLIGYTSGQLKDVYEHERVIWDLFVQNNLLRTLDINIIKNYIGESPKTAELGEASPGNIGSFAGWQIIKKFMSKNSKLDLSALMSMDNERIFQEAKYKP